MGVTDVVPFLLADALIEVGAILIAAPNFAINVVIEANSSPDKTLHQLRASLGSRSPNWCDGNLSRPTPGWPRGIVSPIEKVAKTRARVRPSYAVGDKVSHLAVGGLGQATLRSWRAANTLLFLLGCVASSLTDSGIAVGPTSANVSAMIASSR